MDKKAIVLDLTGFEIFESVPTKFGNGAHVLIPKEFVGKKIKIIFGKSKIVRKKLEIDFSNSEILDRIVKKFGTGAHVVVPKNYSGKELNVVVENE